MIFVLIQLLLILLGAVTYLIVTHFVPSFGDEGTLSVSLIIHLWVGNVLLSVIKDRKATKR